MRIVTPGASGEPVGEPAGEGAAALDHRGQPGPPERAKRGVDREPAGAPRGLGAPSCTGRARRRRSRRSRPRRGSSPSRWAATSRTNTSPESYGTLSHLWASVVHESASARGPAIRSRSAGAAAAHRPNAPSTWSQPPCVADRARRSRGSGSNAPVFTLPAWAQTIVGPSQPGQRRRAARRPASGPARRRRPGGPGRGPARASGATTKIVTCASSPTTTCDRRRAEQPALLDVPADRAQDRVAGGGERGEVGHRRAGREARPTMPAGRPNRSSEPAAGDLLGDRGGRRDRRRARRSGPRRSSASRPRAPPAALPPMTNPK